MGRAAPKLVVYPLAALAVLNLRAEVIEAWDGSLFRDEPPPAFAGLPVAPLLSRQFLPLALHSAGIPNVVRASGTDAEQKNVAARQDAATSGAVPRGSAHMSLSQAALAGTTALLALLRVASIVGMLMVRRAVWGGVQTTKRRGRPAGGIRIAPLQVMAVCVILVLLSSRVVWADPLNRDSPQSAVTAFLQACHSKDYRRAARYLDLRKLPSNERSKQGTQLAEQLGQILDADTRFDEAELSKDPDGAERQSVASFHLDNKDVSLQLERVKLRSDVSVWLFASDSVNLIPRIAKASSDSLIEKYMPDPLVNWKLLDIPLWQWLALVLLAGVLSALSRIACRLAMVWLTPAMKRIAPRIGPVYLEDFMGPLRLLLVALGFRAGMEWIAPPPRLARYLEHGVALLFFWAAAWLGMKVVDLMIMHVRAALHAKQQTFAYSVLPLATRVTKIIIAVLAAVTVLSNWGYNTTTILAGLGVGGVAVALAAQKTIENLFGGISVITDRPVIVGDYCKFGDRAGTIEDIGLRSTRIRTADRTLVTVPNGAFSMMTLENFSRKDKTWFHVMLNLRRDTTPDQVRELLRSLTRILQRRSKVETGNHPVKFAGVGTYSLDLEVNAYFSTTDDDEMASIQEELFLEILDAIEAEGTALALPTQAYYTIGNGSTARESASRPGAASPR